jgi:hypothetical protein
MRLSRAQFEALFDGLDWRRVYGPRRVRGPTAANVFRAAPPGRHTRRRGR